VSEVMYCSDKDADGVVVMTLTKNNDTSQVDIRIQKSLEIKDDTVLNMSENAISMLSEFMSMTKTEQRLAIENCKNIKIMNRNNKPPVLTVVNIDEQ